MTGACVLSVFVFRFSFFKIFRFFVFQIFIAFSALEGFYETFLKGSDYGVLFVIYIYIYEYIKHGHTPPESRGVGTTTLQWSIR